MDPNLLDIIIILTMLVSGVLALTQGFVKEILSLIGWVISFISVTLFMPEAGKYLRPFFESQALSDLITISIIFIATLLAWRLLSLFIGKLFKFTSIGYIDRTFGFLFGLLRVYILASIIFGVFIQEIENEKRPLYIQSSNLIMVIESSNNFLFNNFPELESFNYQSYNNQSIFPEEERDKNIE
jgi:membrane protein required for colicin V production